MVVISYQKKIYRMKVQKNKVDTNFNKQITDYNNQVNIRILIQSNCKISNRYVKST